MCIQKEKYEKKMTSGITDFSYFTAYSTYYVWLFCHLEVVKRKLILRETTIKDKSKNKAP